MNMAETFSFFVGNFAGDTVKAEDLSNLFTSRGFQVLRVDMKKMFAFVFCEENGIDKEAVGAEMNGK